VSEDGGEKDGVVYLGKSSFKMKAGVVTTPPGGMAEAPPRTTPAPPRATPVPRTSLPPRATPVPAPLSRTPRPPGISARQPTMPPVEDPLVRGVAMAKTTFIGVCLTAFSSGIMCTIAIDHFWPRGRAECSAPVASAVAAPPAESDPGFVVPPEPAMPPATLAEETPPIAVVTPRPAAAPPPTARVVVSTGRATASPGAAPAPARPGPAQGRATARKRSASTPGGDKMMTPTGVWIDPFE